MLERCSIPVGWKNDTLYLKTLEDDTVMLAVKTLVAKGIGVLRLTQQQMSLEDIFLSLTGKQVSL